MSSWSSTMPAPPPRSERSRSPSRGAYGRPPYSDPYADPYREHWDTYNRDRAWADYERDRGSYDHGRRGRSRSPPPDDSKFYLCKHPKWLITHIQQGANVAGLHLRMNGNGMTLDLVMRIMVSLLYILIAWKSLSLFQMVTVATAILHHEAVDPTGMVMGHVLDVALLRLTRIPWIIQRL